MTIEDILYVITDSKTATVFLFRLCLCIAAILLILHVAIMVAFNLHHLVASKQCYCQRFANFVSCQ